MRGFLKKHKGPITLVIAILAVYILLFSLGISCPIKYVFDVSCPGCGMTRAALSALRLDFDGAFYYHPLWILVLPSLLLWLYFRKRGWKTACRIIIAVALFSFLAVYFVRLFSPDNAIVTFSPEDSIAARAINYIFNNN